MKVKKGSTAAVYTSVSLSIIYINRGAGSGFARVLESLSLHTVNSCVRSIGNILLALFADSLISTKVATNAHTILIEAIMNRREFCVSAVALTTGTVFSGLAQLPEQENGFPAKK